MWANSLLFCTLFATGVLSVKFPATARRFNPATAQLGVRDVGDTLQLTNSNDTAYFTTIKLGGTDFPVLIDTGSSDLWVYPQNATINTTNTTDIPISIPYAIGSANGTIAFADLELGNHRVPSQAFLDVNVTKDVDVLFASGISGLIGLSFDTSSNINLIIERAFGNDSTIGRTPVSNIFHQQPDLGNFISVLLGRTGELDGEVSGIFTVSEYIEPFAGVQNEPKLPRQKTQVQQALDRWNVEVDGISVNGQPLTLGSSFSEVDSGKLIALLDTGYSTVPVPNEIADAIYSSVADAVKVESLGVWVVPCLGATEVVVKIGGKDFPIHPLDLTQVQVVAGYTACISTFRGTNASQPDLDLILGSPFLRNAYAVFDFGNETDSNDEGPFSQLLSLTKFDEAKPEFYQSRNQTLQQLPPALPPADLVNILNNQSATN